MPLASSTGVPFCMGGKLGQEAVAFPRELGVLPRSLIGLGWAHLWACGQFLGDDRLCAPCASFPANPHCLCASKTSLSPFCLLMKANTVQLPNLTTATGPMAPSWGTKAVLMHPALAPGKTELGTEGAVEGTPGTTAHVAMLKTLPRGTGWGLAHNSQAVPRRQGAGQTARLKLSHRGTVSGLDLPIHTAELHRCKDGSPGPSWGETCSQPGMHLGPKVRGKPLLYPGKQL
ncbi:hypothetical protein Cadr_000019594 [Camelus dromedarius]|uniref:Uncharacterized protein n=1 Tax=Camelus dromedarius TaxID=9838 RepID=A0A5N4D4B7_CAMDR|nr:hypothetical protein Cadr_000019594 [Camelus dromedarius]